MKKVFLLILVAAVAVAFFASGLQRELTLEGLKASLTHYKALAAENPEMMMAGFAAFYIPLVAISLPGVVALGLAAGALFGPLAGTLLVSFASTIGATLACGLSRYLLRDWVQRKLGHRMVPVDEGIREEGSFYLFSLRLIPVVPFFAINMAMGLTPMRLTTFFWVSQLGMLPGTAVFINAGSHLGRIDSLSGILSPGLLFSLALLGMFPLATRRCLRWYRRHFRAVPAVAVPSAGGKLRPATRHLSPLLKEIGDECVDCGICSDTCAFLTEHGTPGELARRIDAESPLERAIAYQCSLCGLCNTVCPQKVDPVRLFLALRREQVESGHFNQSAYRAILAYERRGASPLFSWYGLPRGCDTVFFPGCTLPGTRPGVTLSMFHHLQKTISSLGIVFDCCTKPSHDLGRQDHFEAVFGEMVNRLTVQGVKTVLVACPNCHKVFQQYGGHLAVRSVYEVVHAPWSPGKIPAFGGEVVVHDACAVRNETELHKAIRRLLSEMGIHSSEMRHRGRDTFCCGEGGMVNVVRPELARGWADRRHREAAGRRMVAYCAGCTSSLERKGKALHIADLLYRPRQALAGRPRVARPPFTYLNRLLLKRRLKRELAAAESRLRDLERMAN